MNREQLGAVTTALDFAADAIRGYRLYPEPADEFRRQRLDEIASARHAVVELFRQQQDLALKARSQ